MQGHLAGITQQPLIGSMVSAPVQRLAAAMPVSRHKFQYFSPRALQGYDQPLGTGVSVDSGAQALDRFTGLFTMLIDLLNKAWY